MNHEEEGCYRKESVPFSVWYEEENKGGGEMPQVIYDYHHGMEAEQYAFSAFRRCL